MDGYLTTQLLYVAATLGIAGHLAGRELTADAVASLAGANPGSLQRVMWGLAAEGIVRELPEGTFALTETGALLVNDVPGSMRGAILDRGDLYYRAAAGPLEAGRDGGSPFQREYGSSRFDYLRAHPEQEGTFQESMTARSRMEAAEVVAGFDFSRFDTILDIGGGSGILLESIL
jgi:hypothetical protein